MHLGQGVFNRHGNVLLGNIRGSACTAIAPVEMDNMGSGIIASHGYHIHVSGGRYLDRHQCLGVHRLNPIHVFFVVFHRIHAVEGEGREQGVSDHGLTHTGHARGYLIS